MPSYTLYEMPPTRSQRVRWAFGEVGVQPESVTIDLTTGAAQQSEHLARHPLGKVPAVSIDGAHMIESSAIVMHLAEAHPDANLIPKSGPSRAKCLQWMFFGPGELDGLLAQVGEHTRLAPPAKRIPAVAEAAESRWKARAAFLEDVLAKQTYLLGDTFSAADIVIGHSVAWAAMFGLVEKGSGLASYLTRLHERPAFSAVWGSAIAVFQDPHAAS